MADIGEPIEIVEIPEPLQVPETVPAFEPERVKEPA